MYFDQFNIFDGEDFWPNRKQFSIFNCVFEGRPIRLLYTEACGNQAHFLSFMLLFWKFYFLFLEILFYLSEGKGERKAEKYQHVREKHLYPCFSHSPIWGPGLQPRCVPWLEIELTTFWFAGMRSIRWATTARAGFFFFFNKRKIYITLDLVISLVCVYVVKCI